MRKPEKHVARDGVESWRVRFRDDELSPRTGRPLQSSETFDTYAQATRFAAHIQHMGAADALSLMRAEQTLPADSPTLDELAEGYFAFAATRHRSDRTVADYRRDYDNWIQPALGHRPATSIREADVQALVDSMQATLSPKSVADRHAILFGVFNWAAAPSRGKVRHNPCIGTDLPKRVKTPPKGLRPAEWHALYPALANIDQDAADLALGLLATGWRISELSALSAYDVEDDGRRVTLSMGRVIRRNAAGEHVIVDDGKSDAAMRRVTLDDDASEMVRRRMDRVVGDGLVFTTAKGSQWHSSNFNARCWTPAVKACGLARRPTPHWLRHTAVGWLILTGKVSLPEIQRRIGHEHISTTIDVYGRMIEDVSSEALDAFARMRLPDRAKAVVISQIEP